MISFHKFIEMVNTYQTIIFITCLQVGFFNLKLNMKELLIGHKKGLD